MKRQSLTTLGKSVASGIALISIIGGGIWALGKPPFANEQYVQSQFQQYDTRLAGMRLNDVDAQIVKLERDRANRRLTEIENDLLRRLYSERKQLLCQLKIERCG
jgi:hypothetical protein